MSRNMSPHRLRSAVVVAAVVGVVGLGFFSFNNLIPNSIKENVLGAPITIPAQYGDLIKDATTRCPAISEELFAAQMHAESSFNPMAESPAGAQGIAQFMPYTWKHYGIDADGDGLADVWNPVDAIHSAARMNCINRKLVKGLDGPRIKHTFAAYNAGVGTVLEYGGIPPFPETQEYIERIFTNSKTLTFASP
jgi:soluble lytic murein transglycosylase-like protein